MAMNLLSSLDRVKSELGGGVHKVAENTGSLLSPNEEGGGGEPNLRVREGVEPTPRAAGGTAAGTAEGLQYRETVYGISVGGWGEQTHGGGLGGGGGWLADARRVVSCIEEEIRGLETEEKEWRGVLAEMKELQALQEGEYRRVEEAMERRGADVC